MKCVGKIVRQIAEEKKSEKRDWCPLHISFRETEKCLFQLSKPGVVFYAPRFTCYFLHGNVLCNKV